jgi:hypothetical protein
MRVGTLGNMAEILETLGGAFREEGVPRAELRLQRWFLNGKIGGALRQADGTEELRIWAWQEESDPSPTSWEVCFPLLGPDDKRIGSLVLWEDGHTDLRSISYLQVINRALRQQLQNKLHGFEWAIATAVNSTGVEMDADGLAIGVDGVPIAGSVMHLPPTHRTPTNRTPANRPHTERPESTSAPHVATLS